MNVTKNALAYNTALLNSHDKSFYNTIYDVGLITALGVTGHWIINHSLDGNLMEQVNDGQPGFDQVDVQLLLKLVQKTDIVRNTLVHELDQVSHVGVQSHGHVVGLLSML
jgi:hypothetical protein